MEEEARILLDDAVDFCRRDGRDERLVNMLAQSRAVDLTDTELVIEAPSRFAIAHLDRNRAIIESYLQQIAFMPLVLEIRAPGDLSVPTAPAAAGTPAGNPLPERGPMPSLRENAPAPDTRPAARDDMGAARADAAAPSPMPATTTAAATATAPSPATPPAAATLIPTAARPAAAVPVSHEKDPLAVKVTTTLSRDQYLKLVGEMNSTEPPRPSAKAAAPTPGSAGPATQPVTPPETYPQMPISSKFTFDTFVYGEENKHAYHSAQRFAAFADEPGQCNSLFIYGSSGLGKTHLLLAIKNYLSEHKPAIRVKYANSQAYIDDFINEISRQKTEGRAILREYHDANVLIIDDIQNIIGKQASIEYFFSLMDEFIRENKKIVIASDRAPKKLGMDERLTSRFNAGMLCLVSEPGFEMKYTILKRYYESIIKASGDASAAASVDASLLGAFQQQEGKPTDQQLRHMADISGNNIRELESFCERCASLSFEREQAGGELSGEDIERVADEYFDTVRKVIHIDTVQAVVEEFYHVSHEELIGPKRSRDIAFARHVAVYLANSMCDLSSKAIGEEFGGRDHSTVINSLKVVEKKIKEDRRVCEDLQQLKNKITLKS